MLGADSTVQKPAAEGALPRHCYWHGEAWASESLPFNAAMKLGWPHIYVVLGGAIGAFDHGGSWAWGGGLGTVGRPRGRFTPSLDLVHWVVAGANRSEGPQGQLTQLRPALAWQLKRGGRWQLVGGPTLNLATTDRDAPGLPGTGARWTLGQNQWRWLDADGKRASVRLWPGVQVGLRF